MFRFKGCGELKTWHISQSLWPKTQNCCVPIIERFILAELERTLFLKCRFWFWTNLDETFPEPVLLNSQIRIMSRSFQVICFIRHLVVHFAKNSLGNLIGKVLPCVQETVASAVWLVSYFLAIKEIRLCYFKV